MRQSCDKTGPDDDEAHRGIPRDTNGDPIFLILPEGVRMKYQAGMTACEMAWREGESLAIAEAATLTHLYRQPMPAWLEQAIVELAMAQRNKDQAKRHAANEIHLMRYMTVRDLKVGTPSHNKQYVPPTVRVSWDDAYEKAAEILSGSRAAGSAATMKADYAKVRRDLNARRHGKYFTLKDRRYRQLG